MRVQWKRFAMAIPCWVFGLMIFSTAMAQEWGVYNYVVQPGDTLSEITLMYTGSLDYRKIARKNGIPNPDLIYPSDKIYLSPSRPLETLARYLRAIYDGRFSAAYRLLSSDTKSRFSRERFIAALAATTFYDLRSQIICADFRTENRHVLQVKLRLREDPAYWGFHLVREKYKWTVLLFDLNPTSPQSDGTIEWRCDG